MSQENVEIVRKVYDSLRDPGVTRAKHFQSKAEALEAVGLSEQDAHADS